MLRNPLYRAMVGVFALAVIAFIVSGVPDDKGTDAAIGWWSFVALALVFIALVGVAIARAVRDRGQRPRATAR